MTQTELLTKIAEAMLEFKNEKKHSKSFPSECILIDFINLKTGKRYTFAYDFDIDKVVANLLDSEFVYSPQININKYLYDTLHGPGMMSNFFYRHANFTGKELVEKVELLIATTQLNAKDATKALLEIYHAETMKDGFDFIAQVKKAVDVKSK